MGADPTYQIKAQVLDNELWEAEGVLQIPPCVAVTIPDTFHFFLLT